MTNREKKLWDILNKYGFSEWRKTRKCLFSDLTALISEHYVAKAAYIALENTLAKAEAKNLELLQQRDELKEALEVCHTSLKTYGSHPLIDAQVKAAIKNTEKK